MSVNSPIRVDRSSDPEAAVGGIGTRPRLLSKIRYNLSTWVLWWRLLMGAPQTPKPVEKNEHLPRSANQELRDLQPERKVERRRAINGPRRRGLDNDLEGERRRPMRKPQPR